MSDWDKFQSAYQAASPDIKQLIDSEQIPACCEGALSKRGLLQLQRDVITSLSYHVLGIYTLDDIVKKLSALGIADSLQFMAEIQTCLTQSKNSIERAPTVPPSGLASEIAATEALYRDLGQAPSVRTMANDIAVMKHEEAPIHISRQSDILQQPHPPVPPPPPAPPRWESEA